MRKSKRSCKKQQICCLSDISPESITETISQILIFLSIKPYKYFYTYITNMYIHNISPHMLLSAPTVLRVEIRKYDSWYCQALGVLPVKAMNAWSSPPQPGMCHWLGVECWKTLSDRNFSFICVHIKKAILAPIISLRSFIVLILFLEVLRLSGDWKSCAVGWRLSSASAWSPVPSGCCCTRSGLGSGAGKRVLPAWPGVRAAGERSSSQKLLYGRNARLSLTSAASLSFIFNYLPFIIIRWGGAKFADWS